ncbi:putative glutamine amidotransferase [Catenibacillus scindens]|uniref:Putative glutamine amidotransferase n=1 Tax=Catenibacillus scindens TaxID=673271 RepID=A0A7W8H9P0_9FIRM|nr:type 1 glutamine amidotransferase [Catenibacillus scindens]MBB5264471.1 putative glutamine amidotransferase [Catenibacillus scindens]
MSKILIAAAGPRYDNYVRAVRRQGADSVLSLSAAGLASFDGLLLPGGYDVNPVLYGEKNTASRHIDDFLDLSQLALLDHFVRAKKPVLGICRGHQVINVYFGGTLIQHMAGVNLHQHPDKDLLHPVTTSTNFRLYDLYKGKTLTVNSNHHQAIGRIGKDLIPVQRSPDGCIEAMIHRSLPLLSVQWHPERMPLKYSPQGEYRATLADGSLIFRDFIGACSHQ